MSRDTDSDFIPSKSYTGSKPGYVFKRGSQGVGYYIDALLQMQMHEGENQGPEFTRVAIIDDDDEEEEEEEEEETPWKKKKPVEEEVKKPKEEADDDEEEEDAEEEKEAEEEEDDDDNEKDDDKDDDDDDDDNKKKGSKVVNLSLRLLISDLSIVYSQLLFPSSA
jgi:hypothetical protein